MIEFYQDTLIYFDQLQMEKKKMRTQLKKLKVKFTSLRKINCKNFPPSFILKEESFFILRTEEATMSKNRLLLERVSWGNQLFVT